MKLDIKRVTRMALAALTVFAFASGCFAQDYPNRPVKIIVGYPPGGAPDTIARALAPKLSEILGQPFVIDNKPGAGATLATGLVAKSPADGYTLLMGETGQLVIAPFVYKALSYNTLRDLVPVALVTTEAMLLVSSAKSNIKTLPDLIREAKANPGKVPYGSAGIGTIHHLASEAFKAEAGGLDMPHIPYKGSGQTIPAVLAGDVPVAVASFVSTIGHIRAGSLHLLAVGSATRLPSMPDVPAISELLKGYEFTSEIGVLAPAGLPPAILAKLTAAIKQATESPDFISKFKGTITNITYETPGGYTENLMRNLKKFEQAVKLAKIQPE